MDDLLATVARGAWAQCWQVTTLILLVGVVVKFVGRDRPHLASVLWLVVLAKCVTPPIVSSPWGIFCWMQTTDRVAVVRPAAQLMQAGREHANLFEGDADGVVTRLSSHEGTQAMVDREPRSESLLVGTEGVVWRPSSRRAALVGCLLASWVTGCALVLVVMIVRVRSCWRKLEMAGEIEAPAVFKILEGIRRRFGLRRMVKLWITPTSIGPAVIGIWRPTIILPAALVDRKSPIELEPLLAHELMHICRGDLWTGLLQTLAVGFWWFHPLVRLASRLLTREVERCCDEQVIAHLHYEPKAYADSLIDVLTLKQQLQPVPVCPGIRPIDVTSQRLERIMRLGHGCHKRTPLWCWVAMLLLAIVALPGAALLARRQSQPTLPSSEAPWASLLLSKYQFGQREHESGAAAAELLGEELTTQSTDVGDLLPALEERIGESADTTRKFLVHFLRSFVPGPRETCEGFESDPSRPSITASGNKLVVRHTKTGHECIARQLGILREHGFAELCVEVRVLSGPAAVLNAVSADWKLIGGTSPTIRTDDDVRPGGQTDPTAPRGNSNSAGISGTVESVVERQLPAMVALLNEAQVRKLIRAAQDHPTTNIIFAPKITVFNGQSARIEDGTQRPFVVGVKPAGEGKFEPQIRDVTEGTTIRIRPELHKDQRVHLDVGVTLSSVKDVETAHFAMGGGKQLIAVQVPEVTTMRVQSSVEMELDQFLAIGIPATKTDKKEQPSCILVNVRNIEGPFVAGATDSAAADTRDISPARPLFAPDEIIAKVGEKVIRYGEIKPTVDLMLELVSAHAILVADEKPLDAYREELTKAAIERAVQRKLLVTEFTRNLPREVLADAKKQAEMESKLNRQIQVAFYSALDASHKMIASASGEEIDRSLREQEFITRLALLMRARRLRNFDQLDTALQELGTSLQQQIDEFGEQMMGLEAVRNRMPKQLDHNQRQEAEQQALSRIRAATAVWTIYDNPP